jgi:hypothetical protein
VISRYIRRHLRTYMPGGPHVLDKDDEYNGYLIPAGTIILPNQWCVQMFLVCGVCGANMHQGNAARRNGISRAFRILARALGSRRREERAARPREGCVWLRAAVRVDINVLTARPHHPRGSICPGKDLAEDSVSTTSMIRHCPQLFAPDLYYRRHRSGDPECAEGQRRARATYNPAWTLP